MKNAWQPLVWFTCLLIIAASGTAPQAFAANRKLSKPVKQTVPCRKCHEQWSDILPGTHKPVPNARLVDCLHCHAPQGWGLAAQSTFDTNLHLTHLAEKESSDCFNCHQWKAGSGLQLLGVKGAYGSFTEEEFTDFKQVYLAASTSSFLDNRHLKHGVTCSACHAKGVVDQVDNATCLSCHGPLEKLVQKTTPQQHPEENPHKSHLGEIQCTICHVQHDQQKIYCLECHPKYNMHF